ncbi:MAG: DUF3105 domain-containing protein [Anaerolineaceae bacterium]|nr:DUF3105 domain-containing protein [Anaerolineaceae bacterium]
METRSVRSRPNPSQDTIRTKTIWTAVGAAIVAFGVLVVLILRKPAPIPGLQLYGRQLRGHHNNVTIETGDLPPVGGVHHDTWQNCGIYNEPVEPENAIHSMEHGAVWITYQADLPLAQIEQLQHRVRDEQYLLLSPFPEQRSPVVLTAWAVQLEVESAADERVELFIRRYRLGPTTPERGNACGSGGVGSPIP